MKNPAKLLSYTELLTNARLQAAQLKRTAEAANDEYYRHSQHGQRISVLNITEFHKRGADLKAKAIWATKELERSQRIVARLEAEVAAGAVRGRELAVA